MAMYNDKKQDQADAYKKKMAAFNAGTGERRAAAAGVAGGVADWAMYGGAKPAGTPYAAPLPNYTAVNPQNKPVMVQPQQPAPMATAAAPVLARPAFNTTPGNTTVGVVKTLQNPAAPQANQAPPASQPTGAGVPAGAAGGAAALQPGAANTFTGSNGRTVAIAPGAQPAQVGSVQAQSFGGSAAIARPDPASRTSIGQSVMTMNDSPTIQRPGQMTLAGAPERSEYYAGKEARDAQTKNLSDLDSQRFRLEMIAGNPGRRGRAALDALGSNAQQQAQIVNAQAGQAGQAIQSRAKNANDFNIADMGNQGQNYREGLQQEGSNFRESLQQGGFDRRLGVTDATERFKIARPTTIQANDGTFYQQDGTVGTQVVDKDGNPIKGAVRSENSGQVTNQDQFKALNDAYVAQVKAGPPQTGIPADTAAYNENLKALAAKRDSFAGGGETQQGQAAPTLDAYVKAARDAGFTQSDAELAAAFKKKYQQAK